MPSNHLLPGEITPGIRQRGDLPSFDFARMAGYTVDQAVVDGIVYGINPRAPFSVLRSIGFHGVGSHRYEEAVLAEKLTDDSRFIDRVGQGESNALYGYAPDGTEAERVEPSLTAIVKGTALCSPGRRSEVIGAMKFIADLAFDAAQQPGTIAVIRRRNDIIKSLQERDVDIQHHRDQRAAFFNYFDLDDRFHKSDWGRAVVIHCEGIDGYVKASRKGNLLSEANQEAYESVLKSMIATSNAFTLDQVLHYYARREYYFEPPQFASLIETICTKSPFILGPNNIFRRSTVQKQV